MKTYLIAHCAERKDKQLVNVASAEIPAKDLNDAMQKFHERYPQRVVVATGVKGES